ncbi:MAG: 2'-5' RNA ligase family protein [Christensenellales bacterium]|jgi:2'-5' RNA ligase
MAEKRIYLIAQLDRASNEKLAGIYSKLLKIGLIGEQTKKIPYHFTLGSFSFEDEAQVLERAQSVCGKTKAFDISISHIGLFAPKVLFLAPSVNTELLCLKSDLIPGERLRGCHNWVAHATILIDTPVNIQKALSVVSQSFTPFAAKVESVGVLELPPLKYIAEYSLST